MIVYGTEFLLGADPECFIINKKTRKLVSAHGMLPGTKEEPFKVKYGAIQVDGMAAEFNIEPAKTKKSFIRNVTVVLNTLREMIGPEHELCFSSIAEFGMDFIKKQPIEAIELGCDPDFDAWTGDVNPVPNAEVDFITAAGHIHIGWTEGQDTKNPAHLEVCRHLIRNLDYGTSPTMLLDKEHKRRGLYGDIGAFRPKSYGVEYRTPSNFWIQSAYTIGLMYDLVVSTIRHVVGGTDFVKGGGFGGYHFDSLKKDFNTPLTEDRKHVMKLRYNTITGGKIHV